MSVLCIGDLHIRLDTLDEIRALLELVLGIIDEEDPLFVVLLGDILHWHQKGHMTEHREAINFIKKIADKKKVYVLMGNHDRRTNTVFLTDEHYFTGFRYKNVTIVSKVVVADVDGDKYCFVPYVPAGRFCEALETQPYDVNEFRCIFAHQEFTGVHMKRVISSVEPYLCSCLCISGHIHEYQVLGSKISGVGKVVYPGTPLQQYHGESEDKVVLLLQSDGDIKLIPTHITSKRVLKVNVSDVSNLSGEKVDDQTQIIIEASGNELHALAKSCDVQKLRDMGAEVRLKRKDKIDDGNGEDKGLLSFYDILYGMLDDEARQVLSEIENKTG